jgi:ATP-dependent DNA ligase
MAARAALDPHWPGLDAQKSGDRRGRVISSAVGCALTPALLRHQIGHGREFHEKACATSLEGIVSKRADAAYTSGNRGLWVKVKCLHREEFVVVGSEGEPLRVRRSEIFC